MKYLLIILLLTSCDQLHHYNKFIEKGGKIDQVDKIVKVPYLLKGVDGQDSIAYREVNVPCPDPVIETRWKTRFKYKFDDRRFNDSLDHIQQMYSDSLNNALKTHKIDGKTDRVDIKQKAKVEKNENNNETKQVKAKYSIWQILIGVIVGFVLRHVMQKLFGQQKNKET